MTKMNNAANRLFNLRQGSVPDVSGALQDYFQPMTFKKLIKSTQGFQVDEKAIPVNFQGVLQPLTERQLFFKPEGQRAWSWFLLHSDITLSLQVDDVVVWNGKQTRVMSRKDFAMYGYIEYHLVQDWTGSGP